MNTLGEDWENSEGVGQTRTEVATSKQTDCSGNHHFKPEPEGSNSTGKTDKMGG